MILSLHQPNFMPWYPFFQKIEDSDIFVILINCQYTRRNYQNRFNIGDTYYTMSVKKVPRETHIKYIQYLDPIESWKIIKTKLPDYENILSMFDDCICESLNETNSKIIFKLVDLLSIKTEIVYDFETKNTSNERLIEICNKFGADTYLSGNGAKKYMDLDLFKKNNIKVIYQDDKKMIKKPIIHFLKDKYEK